MSRRWLVLSSIVRWGLQLILVALITPLLVLQAFAFAESRETGLMPLSVHEDLMGYYMAWLKGFFGWNDSFPAWGAFETEMILERIPSSAFLVLFTCVLSATLAGLLVLRRQLSGKKIRSPHLQMSLLNAPTVLWASVLMVSFTFIYVLLHAIWPDLNAGSLVLSSLHSPYALRWTAALVTLTVSAGILWDLQSGISVDLERVLSSDYILVARANGLKVQPRVVRNTLIPMLTRIVSKIPILLGEVVIVEYVFRLRGVGTPLIAYLQDSWASPIMAVTLYFVLWTVIAQGLLDLIRAYILSSSPGELT